MLHDVVLNKKQKTKKKWERNTQTPVHCMYQATTDLGLKFIANYIKIYRKWTGWKMENEKSKWRGEKNKIEQNSTTSWI